MFFTDDLLLAYKRCSRRSFLHLYGDRRQQDPERDFVVKLRQENQQQITALLAGRSFQEPEASPQQWQERAAETCQLMQAGVDCIYRGVLSQTAALSTLLPEQAGEVTLVATPTLLLKQPGDSIFGPWRYEPANVKLGRRPKPEYKVVAAYHAQLLAWLQDSEPEAVRLFLRQQPRPYNVNLETWLPRMAETLQGCLQMLVEAREPEVFISRQRCGLCRWHSSCYAIAKQNRHLSLLPGITPSRYAVLRELKIETVEAVALAPAYLLSEHFGRSVALQLVQQAQSTVHQTAMIRSSLQHAQLPAVTPPTASVELYFDIEAEPDRDLDYLLGVLIVDRGQTREEFLALLAETPAEEERIWQEFLTLTQQYPQAPIFHYSEYEVEAVSKLARRYDTPPEQLEALLARFVDLHYQVTAAVTLPVESYSLKALAQWLGFAWRNPEASGEQSVWWYHRWLETGDRKLLEAIVHYNEDDCRATFHLKEWLADFLGQQPLVANG